MSDDLSIFVPRLMDAGNTNAQNLNARALLSRFASTRAIWKTQHYNAADPMITASPRTRVDKLWRSRLWEWHMLCRYQQRCDGIFYPGIEWFDESGFRARKALGRKVPVIGTIEGLIGDKNREDRLESLLGHKVYCYDAPQDVSQRIDRVLHSCDHLIAITPMLAKAGREIYGDKVSLLPLGVDTSIFHPRPRQPRSDRARVLTVATLTERKRPLVMLQLAKRLPDVDFVWYGTGPLLNDLRRAAAEDNVTNISFPGGMTPAQLASEYANADLFVLPSLSEGAPKALQEAAACGLPRIAFGFYEPTIVDGQDGFVVWNDEQLKERIEEVCIKGVEFQPNGAPENAVFDWNAVAPLWEQEIISKIEQLS